MIFRESLQLSEICPRGLQVRWRILIAWPFSKFVTDKHLRTRWPLPKVHEWILRLGHDSGGAGFNMV